MAMTMMNENKMWKYAGREDVCYQCLKELCTKEKINLSEGRIKLEGSLMNQKVIKIKVNATECIICQKHIDEAYSELHEDDMPAEEGAKE